MIGLGVSNECGVVIGPLDVVETEDTVLELSPIVCETTTFPPDEGSSLGFGRGITILPLLKYIHKTQTRPTGCANLFAGANNR